MERNPDNKLQLNPEQLDAITHPAGPLLIIAGAGTGKTTVITERIKWLIEQGIAKPSEILALTFTEKAAAEMEERVDTALPLGYIQTWISTFHSFCEQVLRQEAIHLGLDPSFRIATEAESYLFVKNNLFEFNLNYYRPLGNPTKFISSLITHFNRLRDENISPEAYLEFANKMTLSPQQSPSEKEDAARTNELALAYQKYQQLKTEAGIMDFADLLLHTLNLFKTRPNILSKYQKAFAHILVDEFQDTNYIQNEIALLLAGDDQNITAVCDDDQSIYRWRGAAIYNVLNFKKCFPRAKVVSLFKNYRSTQTILNRAYDFIQNNNPHRLEVKESISKKLKSVPAKKGCDIKLIWCERVETEAEMITHQIKKLMQKNKQLQFQDFAILVRANNHAHPFLQALERVGIPYQFLGPGQLYHQAEIKNLIVYLKVLYDVHDDVAMYRLLTTEYFQFKLRDISFIVSYARENNLSFFETIENIKEVRNLDRATYRRAQKLTEIIHRHLKLVPRESPGQILYYYLQDTGLIKHFAEAKSPQHQREIRNIAKFFDKIKRFETQNPESNIYHFVEYLDFVISQGESPLASEIDWIDNNAVNILTFHSAKGLEFSVVFMVNLVNDRFPTRERKEKIPVPDPLIKEPLMSDNPHLEEERRLFYVGMTRAKEKLFFTGAKFYHDNKRPKRLSPFVTETLGESLEPFLIKPEGAEQPLLSSRQQKEFAARSTELIPKPLDHLSYSQLDTYLICPLQYKYKYVLRVPTPPSSALSFGQSIHQTLAEFYRRHTQGERVNLDLLKELLSSFWINEGYQSKEHESRQKEAGLKMLQNFFKKAYSPQQVVKKIESPFTVKIAGVKISGRIDRVDELPNGNIEIIDYKTGKTKTQKDADKDLQLSIYSLAATEVNILNCPLDKQVLTFYFLEEGKKVITTRDENDLQITKEKIKKVLQEIRSGNYTPRTNVMCNYCSYQLLCPVYRGNIRY